MAGASDIKAGAAFIELYLKDAAVMKGLARTQARLKAFSASLMSYGRKMITFAAVAALPFAISLRTFSQFSDKMSVVRAVTQATTDQFKALTEEAKRLGRTTSFTASQVAEGMISLGRAGFGSDQILAAIPAVLDLARATDTELGNAAEIAAATLRGFKMEATETTHVADVLTATANASAQTLSELGESMKYVAPLAAEANESLEDTAAALGLLANNGIKGSMAGTALARAFKNLTREPVQKTIAGLGVAAADVDGNLRPVADILGDIGRATAKMGTAKRLSIFEAVFGRGQAAALKMANAQDFQDMRAVLTGVDGTARETAKTMDDNLGGSFRRMMSAIEGVQIAIGEALTPTLRSWMQVITGAAGAVTALVEKNHDLFVSAVKWIAIIGGAGAALLLLGTLAGIASFALGGLLSIISAIGTGLSMLVSAIGFLLSPIGLIIAAAGALGYAIFTMADLGGIALGWLGDKWAELKGDAQAAIDGIRDALIAGDLRLAARVLWAFLKLEWTKGTFALKETWFAGMSAMESGMIEAFYGTLAGMTIVSDGLRSTWAVVTTELADLWGNFINMVLVGWNSASSFLQKAWTQLKGFIDSDIDVEAEIKRIEEERVAKETQIDVDFAQESLRRRAQLDRELDRIERDKVGTLAQIGSEADKAQAARQAAQDKQVKDLYRQLARAKADLADAIADAADARAGAEAEGTDLPSRIEDLKDRLKNLMDGSLGGISEKLETRGTFSAVAAFGMGKGTEALDEMAGYLNNIERTNQDIADAAQNGLAFGP